MKMFLPGVSTISTLLLIALHSPIQASVPSVWDGVYLGLNASVVINETKLIAGQINYLPEDGYYNPYIKKTSAAVGFQVGYLKSFMKRWVGGIEFDAIGPGVNNNYTFWNETHSGFDSFTVKSRWQDALRLRLGYSLDRYLPYFTIGASFTQISLKYTNEDHNYYSTQGIKNALILGGGVEYSLTEKFSIRGEYLYTNLSNALILSVPVVVGIREHDGYAKISTTSNILRAAISYHW